MHGMSAFREIRIARARYIYDNTMIRSQNWIKRIKRGSYNLKRGTSFSYMYQTFSHL